ncbi:MAG: hypothetical protein ACJ72Z_09705 [Pyrinomonadaceae bacterium]
MEAKEILKNGRDALLKLHKSLLDRERAIYERIHGPVNAGQFLNILLEDADFAWLRKFSTLIVEIDELFAQKDGVTNEAVELHITKLRELISMKNEDEAFRSKYQSALQADLDAAAHQGTLKELLKG